MKKLIFLLLFIISAQAQWSGYGGYSGYGSYIRGDGCTKYITSGVTTLASWIFDDVNNSTPLTDLSGNGNTLTPSAGFDYANQFTGTAQFCNGTSLKFDGVNDYFYIAYADAVDLNIGTGDFTIEVLFTTTSDITTFQPIVVKGDNNANKKGYMVFVNNGYLMVRVYDGSGTAYVSKNYSISASTNYYFALSIDRDGEQFGYLNGTKVWTQSSTNSVDISANYNFYIGTENTLGAYSKLYVNQVFISNVAKSESSVAAYWGTIQ